LKKTFIKMKKKTCQKHLVLLQTASFERHNIYSTRKFLENVWIFQKKTTGWKIKGKEKNWEKGWDLHFFFSQNWRIAVQGQLFCAGYVKGLCEMHVTQASINLVVPLTQTSSLSIGYTVSLAHH
jgi:hypothetical protein